MTPPYSAIFMGTPDFAVPTLTALADYGCRIPLVVTQPDRPKGRGRVMTPPPVKKAALDLGYPVIQPESIHSESFINALRQAKADFFVVVAFGHVLSKRVLEIPNIASINLHASLLPRYRGPAPIHWAIIDGEGETGVTSMLMDKGLDTGEILMSLKTPIYPDDTAGTLHDRLADIGGELIKATLSGFQKATIRPVPQNHAQATYARMLKKSDGRIDWTKPAAFIERFIRGMSPWPGAYTHLGKKRIKIFKGIIRPLTEACPPGSVIRGLSNELRVATGRDALSILEIQGESGKRLPIEDYLKGNPIPQGIVMT